jgi:hypothetical protein
MVGRMPCLGQIGNRLCAVPTGPYYDGQPGIAAGESRNATEDLMHFMLECPAYGTVIFLLNTHLYLVGLSCRLILTAPSSAC